MSHAAQRTLPTGTLLHHSGALPASVELLRIEQRTVARLRADVLPEATIIAA